MRARDVLAGPVILAIWLLPWIGLWAALRP
jgi:hypothetical protein